jgi:hypothetical protein
MVDRGARGSFGKWMMPSFVVVAVTRIRVKQNLWIVHIA